jgi:hypothetical protein
LYELSSDERPMMMMPSLSFGDESMTVSGWSASRVSNSVAPSAIFSATKLGPAAK